MDTTIYTFPDRNLLSTHIGKILKKLRKNQNLKQSDFAYQCQISRNTVSLVERGQVCPTFDVIYRMCIVLDISISDFIYHVETSINRSLYL